MYGRRWTIYACHAGVLFDSALNIAGTGPIFGAILGACFGPVALSDYLGGIFSALCTTICPDDDCKRMGAVRLKS